MASGRTKDGRRLVVRRARPADLHAIVRNMQAVADEDVYIWTERVSDDQKASISKTIGDPKALMAVAEVDGRQVGYLTLRRYGDARKTRHLRNLGMAVVDGYRSAGVGAALMDHAISWARKKGVEKIVLSVFSSNDRAKALYDKSGFVVEGTLKGQQKIRGEYVDEVVMGLHLSARTDKSHENSSRRLRA